MAVDWSELPPELLESVARKLTVLIDYIRFRAVCVSWRSSIPRTPQHLPCQLPWLLLPQNRLRQTRRRGFFSLSDNRVHFLDLPEASHRRRCCGSSHGWLVILDESPEMYLLNPLTRSKIHLPPLSAFPNVLDFNFYNVGREYVLQTADGDIYTCNLKEMRDSFVKKVILSSSPWNDSDFVALAILHKSGDLAFCKSGDQSWKFIEDARSYCEDVIYFDGLFYAANKYGAIVICDVNGSSVRVSVIDTPRQIGGDMQYLVHLVDELLLVTRYFDFEYEDHQLDIVYRTAQFQVHRLGLSGPKWERVASLGDCMLFLGENSSLALPASDFPGCKGSCIYYTDDLLESNYDGAPGDNDLGIYNLEDGSIEPLPCYPCNSCPRVGWPPPIWVTPSLC